MSTPIKVLVIISAIIVILALVIFLNSLIFGKKPTTNTHELTEKFKDVSLITSTADIEIIPAEDNLCRVVCYEKENMQHAVSVSDGALRIELNDTRRWYEHIGFWLFGAPKITVYLPKAEYGALKIDESTGDIAIASDFKFSDIDIHASTGDISNLAASAGNIKIKTSTGNVTSCANAGGDIKIKATTGNVCVERTESTSLEISVSTGRVTLNDGEFKGELKIYVSTGDVAVSNTKCERLVSDGSTGDLTLSQVIASGKFELERSTGDVIFNGCDAGEIFVETDTGDITGTLLSPKVFYPKTDTGHVNLPSSSEGSVCRLSTDTGDIRISINTGDIRVSVD